MGSSWGSAKEVFHSEKPASLHQKVGVSPASTLPSQPLFLSPCASVSLSAIRASMRFLLQPRTNWVVRSWWEWGDGLNSFGKNKQDNKPTLMPTEGPQFDLIYMQIVVPSSSSLRAGELAVMYLITAVHLHSTGTVRNFSLLCSVT